MNKKTILTLWLICVLGSISGCAGLHDFYVSKADNLPQNMKEWPNGVVVVELKDIRLCLQLDNQFSFRDGGVLFVPIPIMEQAKEITEKYCKDRSFGIELAMKSYDEDFTFNPKEVYLKLETGEYIQASKYYKPNCTLPAPNPNVGIIHGWTVPPPFNSNEYKPELLGNKSQSFEAPKHKWIGFRIYFDTPTPNPGTSFIIEIRGLKKGEESVPVEGIIFKDKKVYRDLISQYVKVRIF
jgi:hypothetical protein